MITKHRLLTGLGGIALATCLTTIGAPAFAQSYNVTEIGVLAGKKLNTVTAINQSGQIAGTATAGPSSDAAFRYNVSGSVDDIGQSSTGSISRGFAINADGDVAGDSTFADSTSPAITGVTRAAIFRKGSAADLGTLPKIGSYSAAMGINASSQVVGFCSPDAEGTSSRAFLWTASTGMQDLGTLGGPSAQALDINDLGVITGLADAGSSRVASKHAFIIQTNTKTSVRVMQDLGTLGGTFSSGTAINENNHVTGYSSLETGFYHAFLSINGKMQDLGSLSPDYSKSDQSFALAINNSDDVVGYTFVNVAAESAIFGSPMQVAFLYRAGPSTDRTGGMVDLNKLIGKESTNYHLYSALGINDKGQVIVSAYEYKSGVFKALLLTPQTANLAAVRSKR